MWLVGWEVWGIRSLDVMCTNFMRNVDNFKIKLKPYAEMNAMDVVEHVYHVTHSGDDVSLLRSLTFRSFLAFATTFIFSFLERLTQFLALQRHTRSESGP